MWQHIQWTENHVCAYVSCETNDFWKLSIQRTVTIINKYFTRSITNYYMWNENRQEKRYNKNNSNNNNNNIKL